jgi:hypothetical protein
MNAIREFNPDAGEPGHLTTSPDGDPKPKRVTGEYVMRRLSSIIIPVPVACIFLCTFAYAGWHLGGRASLSGFEPQIAALERLTR